MSSQIYKSEFDLKSEKRKNQIGKYLTVFLSQIGFNKLGINEIENLVLQYLSKKQKRKNIKILTASAFCYYLEFHSIKEELMFEMKQFAIKNCLD